MILFMLFSEYKKWKVHYSLKFIEILAINNWSLWNCNIFFFISMLLFLLRPNKWLMYV